MTNRAAKRLLQRFRSNMSNISVVCLLEHNTCSYHQQFHSSVLCFGQSCVYLCSWYPKVVPVG